MIENIETTVNAVQEGDESLQQETSVNAEQESTETQKPVQTKDENTYFASARKRAEAEAKAKYEPELQQYKQKLDKLSKVLPEGYNSLDDYINAIEGNVAEQVQQSNPNVNPVQMEQIIQQTVAKMLDNQPELKAMKQQQYDKFLIDSFDKVSKLFPDVKKANDIPLEVWEKWDEGKSGFTLVDVMKLHRYDTDLPKAKQQGETKAKQQIISTAHTSQVQGTNANAEFDDVIVPEEAQKSFKAVGINDPKKMKEYYKKHHRE